MMTDTLLTRIASVLRRGILDDVLVAVDGVHDIYVGDDTIRLLPLADAVIRELKLRQESPQLCNGGNNRQRWVTEWVAVGGMPDNGDLSDIEPAVNQTNRSIPAGCRCNRIGTANG